VIDGHTVTDSEGKILGSGGDVLALATDSPDRDIRTAAEGQIAGNWSRVAKLAGKPDGYGEKKPAAKKTAAKKKATYKTRDAAPE